MRSTTPSTPTCRASSIARASSHESAKKKSRDSGFEPYAATRFSAGMIRQASSASSAAPPPRFALWQSTTTSGSTPASRATSWTSSGEETAQDTPTAFHATSASRSSGGAENSTPLGRSSLTTSNLPTFRQSSASAALGPANRAVVVSPDSSEARSTWTFVVSIHTVFVADEEEEAPPATAVARRGASRDARRRGTRCRFPRSRPRAVIRPGDA